MAIKLSTEQIEGFNRDGAVYLQAALSHEVLSWLTEQCNTEVRKAISGATKMSIFREFHGTTQSPLLRRVEGLAESSPALGEYFRQGAVQQVLTQLIGEQFLLFKDKINLKYPGGNGFAAHLDGHFLWTDKLGQSRRGWREYANYFVNIVIPLGACSRENGCLEIAPRWPSSSRDGDSFDDIVATLGGNGPGLTREQEASTTFRPVEMEPGSILVFDWRIPHRSASNQSNQPRNILYLTYHPAIFGDQAKRYSEDKAESPASEREKGSI